MSYDPFRHGINTGRTDPCPTCGIKVRNPHTLRSGGWCDRLRFLHLTVESSAGQAELERMMGTPQKRRP